MTSILILHKVIFMCESVLLAAHTVELILGSGMEILHIIGLFHSSFHNFPTYFILSSCVCSLSMTCVVIFYEVYLSSL